MPPATSILIATSNPGKVAAFRRLLADFPIALVTPAGMGLVLEVEEPADTFEENALIKARAYRDAAGVDSLADDSGICVDALDGQPGVRSARYGGYEWSPTAQNLLLLEQLRDVSGDRRAATFVSVIAFAGVDGREWTVRGEVHGFIADGIRGSHGFGYDPIFLLPELGRTYSELSPAEKDPVSHRGLAMAAARATLESHLGLLE